jgi:hypothetical protein
MIPYRVRGLFCALALVLASGAVEAGEVVATPACHRCCRKCYDPCQPVGPVRRFLRKVFLRPCPPPPVPLPVTCPPPVPVVTPAPGPAVFLPPSPSAPVPPANLGRPEAVPPAPPPAIAPFPSAGAAYRSGRSDPSPMPIRVDRIASRNGQW